jgi:hypothetical protein
LEEARILERNENSATPFLTFFDEKRLTEQKTNKASVKHSKTHLKRLQSVCLS